MSIVVDIGNSSNWNLIWNQSIVAVSAQYYPDRYYPIPKVTVPILLENHIISVLVTSTTAKETWYYAGILSQKIRTGITVGGNTDVEVQQTRKLYLGKLNLLILPRLATNYSISFDVPSWFEQVEYFVWEYTGTVIDSTDEILEIIKIDLLRIESKIDAL